ncbi:MAG: hypothetical protein JW731_09970 [Bacteroidales bacterium]|nr:hypothetical protein [Bacteroidales bacterium]
MKTISFFIFALSLMILSGCTPSTQLTKTWKDPGLTPQNFKPFEKVLVIARLKDLTANRITEDHIVASMKTKAVQSYYYLQQGDTIPAKVDEKLKKDGFDGIVLLQLTDVTQSINYQPASYYGGFYGYRHASPGYVSEDRTFYVETSIYSLESDKLLWSGTTASLNPEQLDKTLDDILYVIKSELIKEGFIKGQDSVVK